MDIQRIGTFNAALGECPVWHEQQQRLWFMDCRKGLVYTLDPETGDHLHYALPPPTGSFALNEDGRLVVALKEEIALYQPDTGSLQRVARIEDSHPNLRLNDGTALPDGSFVVGTMHVFRAEDEAPLGGLYRRTMDGRLVKLDRGLGVGNGPVMHPGGARFSVCDSAARKIYTYRAVADGTLSERQVFADTSALGSAPDGCCFDRDGGLWTALVHVGAIARFDSQGKLTNRIELPVAHPASLCFGGANLDEIFVTSISDSGRLRAEGALDGAVLRVRGTGSQGAPRPMCRITCQAGLR
jgi:sugar lactone lactonase YvrE